MKNNSVWTLLFWTILIVNVIANHFGLSWLASISKVFIIPALFGFFQFSVKTFDRKMFTWVLLALVFSWLGDILLIFQSREQMFFLFGLASFLISHLLYIFIYRWSRDASGPSWREWIFPCLILAVYLTTLFTMIGPDLDSYLIPVILYALAISGMLLAAYSRSHGTTKFSFILVLTGASLFVLSDSLIALNKFYEPITFAGTWIMLTYGTAQFLIISGLVTHINSNDETINE